MTSVLGRRWRRAAPRCRRVQLVRVRGDAAAPDGEGEAGQAGLELAQHAVGRALPRRLVGVGDEHDDLAGRGVPTVGRRGDGAVGRRRARRARRPTSTRGAPVLLGGRRAVRARDDDRCRRRRVDAQLRGRGDAALSASARPGGEWQEGGDGLLGRALGGADALDLRGDQRAHDASSDDRRRRPRAGGSRRLARRARPPRAARDVDSARPAEQRALVGGRSRGDGEHGARRGRERRGWRRARARRPARSRAARRPPRQRRRRPRVREDPIRPAPRGPAPRSPQASGRRGHNGQSLGRDAGNRRVARGRGWPALSRSRNQIAARRPAIPTPTNAANT